MKKILLSLSLFALNAPTFADDADKQIKESMKYASKAEFINKSRSMVMFSHQGEAVLVSDNPRFVVKGQLYDMWQNKEINSSVELKQASRLLPLSKLKVNTQDILFTVVNLEKRNEVTVFLDPFSEPSSKAVRILRKYASDFRLKFIYTGFTEGSLSRLKQFACIVERDPSKALDMVETQMFQFEDSNECLPKIVLNTVGLTAFVGISKAPTLIAPNSQFSELLPRDLMTWLNSNKE